MLKRNRAPTVRRLVPSLATMVVLAACSDRSESGLLPRGPSFSYEEVEWLDVDGSMNIVEEQSISGTFPEWHGEDPAVSALPQGQQYSCPEVAGSIMLLASDKGTFVIAGVFLKQQDNNYTQHGYPTARYTMPGGTHTVFFI